MLRRIAEAIDRRPQSARQRRAILAIAAQEFLSQLRPRRGSRGSEGYSGWDLSNVARPAFWATLLLSQRRERFAMTLLGQVHQDRSAVRPYVQERRATQEILDAFDRIEPDSLVGFVDVAVAQFHPPGVAGAPLVPADAALEILRAALLRGAMVGELRPDAVRDAWLRDHPEGADDPERHWKIAQGRAESLYETWRRRRAARGRRWI